MTDETKNLIIRLRNEGCGYKKIAKETGESVGVVRHFCNLIDSNPTEKYCPNCGATISFIKGGKQKKFCSDHCRWSYWNKHKKVENRKCYHEEICKNCGKTFMTYGNRHRFFCSMNCYKESRKQGRDSNE